MIVWIWALVAAIVAAGACRLATGMALRSAPARLVRTNVDGRSVPAVLGWGIVAGILAASLVSAFPLWLVLRLREIDCMGGQEKGCDLLPLRIPWELVWLPILVVVGMFLAGLWDDLRGDERPRGFRGHIGALRGGAVTGGIVKLVAGAVIGIVTLWVLEQEISFGPPILLGAAAIALSANLINLLDRAPGRALKVFVLIATPLILLDTDWRLLAAGAIGSAVVLLPFDLRAQGMLGDAGANPLGAMLGLGLILAARGETWVLAGIVVVLLALNLASERWSFSAIIERTPWLARLDHLGRK